MLCARTDMGHPPTTYTRTPRTHTHVFSHCVHAQALKQHNVTDVVRVCESTYDSAALQRAGIKVRSGNFLMLLYQTRVDTY